MGCLWALRVSAGRLRRTLPAARLERRATPATDEFSAGAVSAGQARGESKQRTHQIETAVPGFVNDQNHNDMYLLTKDNIYHSRDLQIIPTKKGIHGGLIAHLPGLSVVAGPSGRP
jgi:hypothetical protein